MGNKIKTAGKSKIELVATKEAKVAKAPKGPGKTKVTVVLTFESKGLSEQLKDVLMAEVAEMISGRDVKVELSSGKILDTFVFTGSEVTSVNKILERKAKDEVETADDAA
jgi:hypothetical protein